MKVSIRATATKLSVTVDKDDGAENFYFPPPLGTVTGAELQVILNACGVETTYAYEES